MAVNQHPEAHQQAPGMPVGMMGMYIFLASEVMFFGALFGVYFYLFGSHPTGWPPAGTAPVNWYPLPFINTFVLVTSGVVGHFGLEAIRHRGRPAGAVVGAGLTLIGAAAMLVLGVVNLTGEEPFGGYLGVATGLVAVAGAAILLAPARFAGRNTWIGLWAATILLGVGFEAGQVYEFANAHITFGGLNQFGSAFFTLTGFHGVHVAGGLVLLSLMLYRGVRQHFSAAHNVGPSAVMLYWHFVDVVWLALFAVLYLAVTA